MTSPLITNALELPTPENYFRGRSCDDICIPNNIILFSRKSAKELQRRNFESYPHHRFVMLFNLMTAGTVSVDGIQWRLEPEQGFLIFPYQFHYFSEFEDSKLVWLVLTFELEKPLVMESFRNRIFTLDPYSINKLMAIIEDYNGSDIPRTNRRLTLKASSLINKLRERLQSGSRIAFSTQNSAKRASAALISSIQEHLVNHSGSLQSVAKIASSLNMSESNLRAVFRQHFNISLGAYLKNHRAHQAILYMQNPSLSLSDVAFQLGFTTLSSFSRFFSNAVGESPRSYRTRLASRINNTQ